ncbi:MAG: 3-hydroxyacyl-CoA dehydrogenase NAD-binding domain-containing protein [Deltaproteobacteria bacterium]|nr:3-hydroxyacyl-CoA dehydrogenase NAD-binding domain-containing protein [Deltaproteobacteria bacterium]
MIEFQVLEEGIGLLLLGSNSEKHVTLNRSRMLQLKQIIADLKSRRDITGLIITGPSEDSFCVGADIEEISGISSFEDAFFASQEGQSIFKALEELPCVKVCAISGPAVGGGFELALSCDYRIGSPSATVGLPEVKLGIVPGFGGTQRLPKIVGVFTAIEIVCSGKLYKAPEALKLGLIDEIVSTGDLLQTALVWAKSKPRRQIGFKWLRDLVFFNIPFIRYLAWYGFRRHLKKKVSETHYPAPFLASKAVLAATSFIKDGFSIESEYLAKTLISETSKNLVYIWIASEQQKKFAKSFESRADQIKKVGILGAGVMGTGIASFFASKNIDVVLYDISEESLANAEKSLTNDGRIKSVVLSRDLNKLSDTDLIIEAVVEDAHVKRSVLKRLVDILPSSTIIGSNTSSISITKLGEDLFLPSRFLGIHFFNPVSRMPIVEIIRGQQTGDNETMTIMAFISKIGKIPIVVDDSPGFLINRILARYLIKALKLAEAGFSIQDIENAAVSFGFPMGPFRLLDHVGLDVALSVSRILHEAFGRRYAPVEKVLTLIEKGHLGYKTKTGFYAYESGKPSKINPVVETLFRSSRRFSLLDFQERCLFPLVDEAYSAFENRVAGLPSAEAENQINIGSIFGFGFPAYTGGVLKWAKKLDKQRVRHVLSVEDEIVSNHLKNHVFESHSS